MKLRLTKTSNYLLAAMCVLLLTPLAAAAEDIPAGAWAGRWLATAKSTFSGAPPRVDGVVIDPDGTVTIHEISSIGTPGGWSYKPQVGEAVPIKGRDGVTVKVVMVNPYRMEHTWNDHGKITHSFSTLSRDGKTQTYYAPIGTYRLVGSDKVVKAYGEVVVYARE
jgi:hypothetical protein